MLPPVVRRSCLLLPLVLAGLVACRDASDSPAGPRPQFAQGDNGTWTVTTLDDPGVGVCDDTECTLREAIAAAASGDNVIFEDSLQGDILLAAGQLNIDKSLTIDGGGRIAVDAQGNSGVMEVADVSDPTVRLAGLTFKNGHADRGGGIAVGISTLTLDGVTVSHNEATIDGGGIYVGLATVTILNSTIANNTAADDGGGIYSSAGGLTVLGSLISGNEGSSGGIHNANGSITVERSTISGNHGAAVAGINGSATLRSTTVTRNVSQNGIGGLSGGTVANSIIAGNT